MFGLKLNLRELRMFTVSKMKSFTTKIMLVGIGAFGLFLAGCTQEQQNNISRSIQNWTGTNGVLDVISEGKVMYRIIRIDKLSTARATGGSQSRPYRFGYGVLDTNQNYLKDPEEVETYFEISDYGTSYFFYENPLRRQK